VTDAAIHRVSGYAYDLSLRLLDHSGSPRPQGARDDKTRVGKRSEVSSHAPPFTLEVSSLGSFGLAPPQAKTFLASSLLAFLETNTEAYVVVATARGVVVAASRTEDCG
jgi:hypothetical protein